MREVLPHSYESAQLLSKKASVQGRCYLEQDPVNDENKGDEEHDGRAVERPVFFQHLMGNRVIGGFKVHKGGRVKSHMLKQADVQGLIGMC